MKARIAVALSTLFILVATLHVSGTALPPGWSFALTSGSSALAELIQNLLLFIPLGATLTLAGVRPLRAVAIGAALSFSVEFLQQWIPGRDPSVGDIICNTVSTALGMALVVATPRLLWTTPQRSARRALGLAGAAVLVWYATGLVLRPILSERPYRDIWTPNWNDWGRYKGRVISAQDSAGDGLKVTVIAASRPPGREVPLVALLDEHDTKVFVLFVDRADLGVRYDMKAIGLTLEEVDLRWRHALAGIAPNDTFTVRAWRDERSLCLSLNSARRCGFGYTIGDGWKLIYYPEHFPAWLLAVLNVLWVAGWTVGVGWWAARTTAAGDTAARKAAAIGAAATAVLLLGLVILPGMTGLKATPITEWLGAAVGLGAGIAASRTSKAPRRFGTPVR